MLAGKNTYAKLHTQRKCIKRFLEGLVLLSGGQVILSGGEAISSGG